MDKQIQSYIPSMEDVHKAAKRLHGVILETPLGYDRIHSQKYNANVLLKREDLQVVRSYKLRGAYNRMVTMPKEMLKNGVVCASAGNHAQGVAYSCNQLEVHGTIFMPEPTPNQKIEQVKMFGGDFIEVILKGDTFDEAGEFATAYSQENQKAFIHPFNDPKIIEGQATVGLEILKQAEVSIDYLFIPIGGGGLAAGISPVFKLVSPETKIIGVEPKGAAAMKNSIEKGQNTKLEKIDKFVDGAAVKKVGDLNFDICKDHLHEIITVEEGEICETILEVYNRNAIVLEPAGAMTLTALDQYAEEIRDKNVVCILSGGNNDITRMEEFKERAMLYGGLKHYFLVKFPQRAGALREFLINVLGPEDDITHFEYIKKSSRERGGAVVGIELKNKNDFDPLLERMKAANFFGEYLNDNTTLMDVLV